MQKQRLEGKVESSEKNSAQPEDVSHFVCRASALV
jgi:hypothetical protein